MDEMQASRLGKRFCAIVPVEVIDGRIATMYGNKTYAGLGFLINKLVKEFKPEQPHKL